MIKNSADLMDPFSDLPLLISPLYAEERPSRYLPDEHHPWHDRLNPLLQDLGGRALRASRVQVVNYDAHHLDYHGANLYPVLPKTDEERIRPIILAAAGYIPKNGIAFTRYGRPYHASLSTKTRTRMWSKGSVRIGSVPAVRAFLCDYVLDQDLSDLSASSVDEFLSTTDTRRKWELGNDFLGRASRRAAEPVSKVYIEALKANLIPGNRGQVASRFLLGTLGMKKQRRRLFGELEAKLTAAA